MNTLDKESVENLKVQVTGLKSIHNDHQEGKIEFEFNDKRIEISSWYVSQTEQVQIASLLKALALPQRDLKLKSTNELRVCINIPKLDVEKYYSPSDIKEMGDDNPIVQKLKAKEHLKNVMLIGSKLTTKKEESNTFTSSRWRNKYLKEAIESLRVELAEENEDVTYVNKQNETVYQRDILFEGKSIGAIEYLEDDSSVTILRSDVEDDYQGQGIGYQAYVKLIEDKIALGKSVGSDSILSAQAQSIYKRLGEAGYKMESVYTRLMTRGKITSLSIEDTSEQRNAFPTVHIDGVGVSDTGYRFKGQSIFTIKPSISLNPSPVINITEGSILSSAFSSFIQRDDIKDALNGLAEGDYDEIESLFLDARNILTHEDNKEIRDSLTMDNVSIHDIQIVSYDELSKSVELDFENNSSAISMS